MKLPRAGLGGLLVGHYGRTTVVLAAMLATVAVLAYIADRLGPADQFSWRALSFNSVSKDSLLAKPKSLTISTILPHDISISFSVKPLGDDYTNIFQTSDGKNGVRMELTRPTKLHLALSENRYLLVDNDFALNRWHKVSLSIRAGEFADLQIDGKKPMRIFEDASGEKRYEINNIVVGSGYIHSRDFQGEIRDFTLNASFYGRYWTIDLAVAILILALLFIYIRRHAPIPAGVALAPYRFVSDAALIFVLVIMLGAAGRFVGQHESVIGKWYQLAAVLFAVILFPIVDLARRIMWLRRIAAMASIAIVAAIVWKAASFHPSMPPMSPFSLLLFATIIILYVMTTSLPRCFNQKRVLVLKTVARIPRIAFLPALFVLMCVGLLETPNWTAFVYSLILHPAITALFAVLALTLTWQYVSVVVDRTRPVREQPVGLSLKAVLSITPYVIFFALAFRTDSLFIPGSEFHWEYFVGPLRTLKSGGSLLWDTPSQYGYLNILLAAAIPSKTSWEGFYLFQGTLLFVAAVLSYRSITYFSAENKLFAFLIVVSGVFFADPGHIGPYPFPSSSVVRFFWCYALIYLGAQCLHDNRWNMRRWVTWGGAAWGFSVLWSAESAIYSTAIFFAPIAASLLYRAKEIPRSRSGPGPLAFFPAVWLGLLLIGISTWTRSRTGHLPDWRMFTEYGFSYASGFGAMPLTYWGPGWVLVLSFFAPCLVLYCNRGNGKAAMAALLAACVWAIGSYYVGRAVPNNVTALLPLISLVLAIGVKLSDASAAQFVRVISLPVFAIVLVTGLFSPKIIATVGNLSVGSLSIDQRLRPLNAELAQLMRIAGVRSDSPVVYYGFAAAMPRDQFSQTSFENNWLPTPLQLLEEPIPPERRVTIIQRFVQKRKLAGYFIQAKYENEQRAEDWRRIIGQSHDAVRTYESANYRIIFYRPKPSAE